MGLLVRALLAVGGGVAALLVGRDAPNFPVARGMLALVAALLLPAAAWFKRKASSRGVAWAGAAWRGRDGHAAFGPLRGTP